MTEDITHQQLQALKDFASSENKELIDKLEQILDDVASTGQYIFQWNFMKPLYAYKLEKITTEFLASNPPLLTDGNKDEEKIEELKEFQKMLLETFDVFTSAPFTLQRISELLQHPGKHYKSTPKFFRGLEKNILVVTTMEPVTPEQRLFLKRSRDEIAEKNTDQKPPEKKLLTEIANNSQMESSTPSTSDGEGVKKKDETNKSEINSDTKDTNTDEQKETSQIKNNENQNAISDEENLKFHENVFIDDVKNDVIQEPRDHVIQEPVIKTNEKYNNNIPNEETESKKLNEIKEEGSKEEASMKIDNQDESDTDRDNQGKDDQVVKETESKQEEETPMECQ